MVIAKQTIIQALETVAPPNYAEEWDNVGLQLGSYAGKVGGVLLTLDTTLQAVQAAHQLGCELIIAHHPLIFRPLKSLRTDCPQGQVLAELLKAGTTVYAAHTNWDNAARGTSWQLAEHLGLKESEILKVTGRTKTFKLVVYLPTTHLEAVTAAMVQAGAGKIGPYSHCSFRSLGVGTFIPASAASPFVGKVGQLEQVEEIRLEMPVGEDNLKKVVGAMRRAHPYEEVAFDVLPVHEGGESYGSGRIGRLDQVLPWPEFAARIEGLFPGVRYIGAMPERVRKVAVCGGSGGSLIGTASSRGAEVLITGDVTHHQVLEAEALGLALVDAGHYATEALILPAWESLLRNLAEGLGEDLKIAVYRPEPSPRPTIE
ncbi:MAG: GTP cyclohydrolase 1 type 2 [Firmicutes bacterium]|nr:GTP cyclohydrolase 1 type 2 [Bacillota bacterium]